ncbi:MAG: aminotransferase class IV, partial [Candidatus Bathyarchaeia archaeon]
MGARRVTEETFLEERFRPTVDEILRREGYFDLFIFHDGRFVKGKDARITPFDHGVLLGDGVFEGIRAYEGYVFKLDEHIDRLFDSAHAMGLRIPLSKEEMKRAVVLTLRKNGLRDAHVRPVVLRGPGRLGLDPRRSVRPTVMVLAYPFPPLLGEKPVRLLISSVRRKSPHSVDSKVKSTSYIDNIAAKLQANAAGMDDAILLDMDGYVAEACGENIFALKGEVLSTPTTTAALHGVTRAVVMEIACN